MALVSIVLTSYNHEKFIGEAIESVINQTFTDWEMFIFDDASIDESWSVISKYNDPRIKAIRNQENQGPIYAFNKLIFELAQGQYIAVHHSDDVWMLDKLARQVQFLDANTEIGAVFTDVLAINEAGTPLSDDSHIYCSIFKQPNRTRYDWLRYFFLNGNALCHPSILIRKQCYFDAGGYRDMLAQLPDFDMWIRLCFNHEIHVLHEKLIKFRVLDNEMNTSGSRPATRIRCINEHYQLIREFVSQMNSQDVFKVFPEQLALDRGQNTQVDYVLARACLDSTDYFLRQFLAIVILFDILNDVSKAKIVKEQYGFSSKDYIAITGKHDTFGREALLATQSIIVRTSNEVMTLQQSIASKNIELAGLQQTMFQKDIELETLQQTVVQKNNEMKTLQQAIVQKNNEMETLSAAFENKDAQISSMTLRALETEEQISALLGSTSWKITKPLRYIRRKFNAS